MDNEIIAGFKISGVLGEGGMGVVYRAYDETLDRTLALKVIRSTALGPEGNERFLREARACSKINHPNIVTVYAAGEDSGRPYLAMELLEGSTLRDMIASGPVPWEQAIRWVRDILAALDRLHAEGIVHRDLKPDNIILTNDNIVKLMDFGIARLASSSTITQEGTALGTVFYMSPEQVRGERVDPRSDIFAMGGVLYQLLSGQLPFPGEEPLSVMYLIQNEPPKPLEECATDLPDGLTAIVAKALSKNPGERFPDARSFAEALNGLLSDEGLATAQLEAAVRKQRVLTRAVLPMIIVVAAIIVFVALKVIDRAPPIDHDLAVHHNELGQNYERQGDTAKAEEEYRLAIVADHTYPQPWNNLGVLAYRRGDLSEADSLFSQAISRDSLYAAALVNRATVQWDQKDTRGAETDFRACLRADSSSVECYNNYGALLLEENRISEARDLLNLGLRRNAGHPYLLKNIGIATLRLGDARGALHYFLEADSLLPGNPEINMQLARWYEADNQPSAARERWNAVLQSPLERYRSLARDALQRLDGR